MLSIGRGLEHLLVPEDGWMNGWMDRWIEHGSWYSRKTDQNPSPQLNFFLGVRLNTCCLQQKNTGLSLQITIQTATSTEVPCRHLAPKHLRWRASATVIDMQSVMVRTEHQRDAEWGCFPLNCFYEEDFEIPWTFCHRFSCSLAYLGNNNKSQMKISWSANTTPYCTTSIHAYFLQFSIFFCRICCYLVRI